MRYYHNITLPLPLHITLTLILSHKGRGKTEGRVDKVNCLCYSLSVIILPAKILDAIRRHAKKEMPDEACGIIAGKADRSEAVYPMKNVEKSGTTFFMDPEEQFKVMKEIRERNLEMTAIYHSHPDGSPLPSKRDIELAFYDVLYLIASGSARGSFSVRAFRIREGKVREEEIVTQE